MMRAAEIRAELKERQIDFTDCFDKESLADKLVKARAGLIQPTPPPAPTPAPVPAYKNGAPLPDNMTMEDAFKAAGWTGEESGKDPSNVDTARSPGLNRNFGDINQSDFKKPYTGGDKKRKGRYG